MGIVSHAQNFEDVLLWRALRHVRNGFYVDIGAQHPVVESVSRAFYENGWRGISVEPSEFYANLLRADRPDEVILQAVVSDVPGEQLFHEIPNTGLSTASTEIASEHRERGFTVQEITVRSITLDELFGLVQVDNIHWLKIDVEGCERQVLAGWQTSEMRPWILVIESTYPNTQRDTHQDWEDLVLKKGYRPVLYDGLNRYYVSPQHPELEQALRVGPNVFDQFQLTETSWAVQWLVDQYASKLQENASALELTQAAERQIKASEPDLRNQLRLLLADPGSIASPKTQEVLDNLCEAVNNATSAWRSRAETESLYFDREAELRSLLLAAQERSETALNQLVLQERAHAEELLGYYQKLNEAASERAYSYDFVERALLAEVAVLRSQLSELQRLVQEKQSTAFGDLQEDLARLRKDSAEALRDIRDRWRSDVQRTTQAFIDAKGIALAELGVQASTLRSIEADLKKLKSEPESLESRAATRHIELLASIAQHGSATLATSITHLRSKVEGHGQAIDGKLSDVRAIAADLATRVSGAEVKLATASDLLSTHVARLQTQLIEVNEELARRSRNEAELRNALRVRIEENLVQTQELSHVRELLSRATEAESDARNLSQNVSQVITTLAKELDALRVRPKRGFLHRWLQFLGGDVACRRENGKDPPLSSPPSTKTQCGPADDHAMDCRNGTNEQDHRDAMTIDELLQQPGEVFVRASYRTILGREADEAGVAHYVRCLARGEGKASVLMDLLHSREAVGVDLRKLSDEEFVDAAFRRLLRRPPDPAGRSYYLGKLEAHGDRNSVWAEIQMSSEARRCAAEIKKIEHMARERRGTWRIFGHRAPRRSSEREANRIEHQLDTMWIQLQQRFGSVEAKMQAIQVSVDEVLYKLAPLSENPAAPQKTTESLPAENPKTAVPSSDHGFSVEALARVRDLLTAGKPA